MGTWHVWTHATALQIENQDPSLGLQVKRMATGVEVRQDATTENAFHFPITTPTIIEDGRVDAVEAFVRVRVNNAAVIKRILVNEAFSTDTQNRRIGDSGPLNVVGQDVQLKVFPVAHQSHTSGPIVVTVNVSFHGKDALAFFSGAAIRFASQE